MFIQQIIYEKVARLPQDKQREVLDFVEFLESRIACPLGENDISCYTLVHQWTGCIADSADDLSFNKKYMEGYGE